MTDDEAKLAAFFAASEPPARDAAFNAEAMARIARRKFQQDLGLLSTVSLLGAAILWALAPAISPALQALAQELAPAAAALTVVAALSLALTGQPFFGLAGEHDEDFTP
jgi:hypothetical protein